jgi:hypothetical protein
VTEAAYGRGYGRMGIARAYALIFGLAYLAVAILELFFPASDPLEIGGVTVLARGTLHIIIHFAVAILALGSYFAGEGAARMVARVIGIVFVVVTILNIVASNFYAELVGLGEGAGTPVVYTIVHAVTAVAALYAGFSSGAYDRTAPAT